MTTQNPLPRFVPPMAATLVQKLPEGEDWLYEVKLDGYRALILKAGDTLQIRSRNNKDLTAAYPAVASAATRLRHTVLLDGELVAVDAKGHPSFQALQNRGSYPGYTTVFYAFDLLHLDGNDLSRFPLAQRKQQLAEVVNGTGILVSASLPGTPAQIIDVVRRAGLEGVIAKRKSSRYVPGLRSNAWQKLKLEQQQEFVVGGYRPGPHGVDALIVGFYDNGSLRFAGKVRAGFTPHVRAEVFAKLKPLHASRCPFVDLPHARTSRWGGGVTAEQMLEMQWVKPTLVAQIRFVEWTAEDHLRHAAFLGVRDDKRARDVKRER